MSRSSLKAGIERRPKIANLPDIGVARKKLTGEYPSYCEEALRLIFANGGCFQVATAAPCGMGEPYR